MLSKGNQTDTKNPKPQCGSVICGWERGQIGGRASFRVLAAQGCTREQVGFMSVTGIHGLHPEAPGQARWGAETSTSS